MAFDPATATDIARPAEEPEPARSFDAAGRSAWLTIALSVMSLVLTLACGFMLWFGRSPREITVGYHWLEDLTNFFVEVYKAQHFQMLAAMLAVGLLLERFFPARRQKVASGGFNVLLACLMLLFQTAIAPFPGFVAVTLTNAIGGDYRLNLNFDAGGSVLLGCAAMLIGIFVFDFFFYWFHRLEHHSRILWQEHAVHHSDVAFNVTTTQRSHFLEFVFTALGVAVPLNFLLDLPSADLAVISLLPSVWVYFVHMNIPIGFGRLWWLATSPQWHRIHHSIQPEHIGKNFAFYFPLLDAVFGTAYVPRPGEFPPTGIEGVNITTLAGTFAFPFAGWYRMATGAAARTVPAAKPTASGTRS
jgi:sterol desaturase/sphingolipid hydroxylase (fatty acid hydroxylase superfamily)